MGVLTSKGSKAILYLTIGTAKIKYILPLRSESINQRADTLTSEAILGNRAFPSATITRRVYEGSIDVELFDVTENVTTPTYAHELLGILYWTIAGKYSSKSVSWNTTAPKIDFIEISHDGKSIYYKDCYVTGFSWRFPSDAVPTATIDVRATSVTDTAPTGYTVDRTGISYNKFYNSKHFSFLVGTTQITTVRNFEMSLSQNVIDGVKFGSLDVAYVEPTNTDLATINIEFYIPDTATDMSLSNTLNSAVGTAWDGGTSLTSDLKLTINSPTKDGTNATLAISDAVVTEYTHDISANDFIIGRASFRAPASGITLSGVTIKS